MRRRDLRSSRISAAAGAGFLIGLAFLLLATWLLLGPDPLALPRSSSPVVHEKDLRTTPRRQILGDPPTVNIDGFERTCMDCHMLFPARDIPPDQLLQHRHIVLNHGINDRCRNCHDATDRNRLVLGSGESISYGNVVRLCARCHGPTYRDWERGMHGRTNGYWDRSRGNPLRLICIECHDPHNPRVPAMDPMAPLPPPDTIRMERQERHGLEVPVEIDPLRQAIRRIRKKVEEPRQQGRKKGRAP